MPNPKTMFSALRYFALAALIVAGVSIFMLFGEFHAYSSDAGQHYALVRALMDLEGWGRPPAAPHLGGLPFYPPLSHWMAAGVWKVDWLRPDWNDDCCVCLGWAVLSGDVCHVVPNSTGELRYSPAWQRSVMHCFAGRCLAVWL